MNGVYFFNFLKVIFLLSPYINTTKLVSSVDLTQVHDDDDDDDDDGNNNNNNNIFCI